jgi:hypothetical protein
MVHRQNNLLGGIRVQFVRGPFDQASLFLVLFVLLRLLGLGRFRSFFERSFGGFFLFLGELGNDTVGFGGGFVVLKGQGV